MSVTVKAAPAESWIRWLPGIALLAVLLLLFRDTAQAMVTIWIRSETFTHAFLVPPIVLWLVWRRRDRLAALPSRPMPWLLVPIAAVCVFWLLGELASVNAATQFALVTLIVLSVPAMFGMAVTRELMFPLAFLYFSVPIGEFLVPTMMESTADMTVYALRWTGIPVYREGLQFVIPSGSWSVVQACSGVRYLIASFMVGTLFAYLSFRSTRRRLIFIAASIVVPVIANWIRAYLIVLLGHFSGNKLAAGADHLIYGWLFFGVVIVLMFLIGARWSEAQEAPGEAMPDVAGQDRRVASRASRGWGVALGVAILLVGTQASLWHLDRSRSDAAPVIDLPAAFAGRWTADESPGPSWQPGFQNPNVIASRSYRSEGKRVSVWIGYYRHEDYGHKLVTSTNSLVAVSDSGWAQTSSSARSATLPAGIVTFRSADLRASDVSDDLNSARMRVWQIYWIGGRFTASDAKAKMLLAVDRLLGRGDDGAVVLISTIVDRGPTATPGDGGDLAADDTLAEFARMNLAKLGTVLEAARDAR
jgi:exosortase A